MSIKCPWLHPNGHGPHHKPYIILIIILLYIDSLVIQVFKGPYLSFQFTLSEKDWKTRNVSETYIPPTTSLYKQNLSEASTGKQGNKGYGQHTGLKRVVWPWPLNMWPDNQLRPLSDWVQPLHHVWFWSNEGVKRYWANNTLGREEWVDLEHWTRDLKINRDHLLFEGNPCTKLGIYQVKGSKDIERTTQWVEKNGLTLTFKHVIWKSIGIIYSLRQPLQQVWYWSSEGINRYWADNTWSTDRQTNILTDSHNDRPTDRPTDLPTDRPSDSCKTYDKINSLTYKKQSRGFPPPPRLIANPFFYSFESILLTVWRQIHKPYLGGRY